MFPSAIRAPRLSVALAERSEEDVELGKRTLNQDVEELLAVAMQKITTVESEIESGVRKRKATGGKDLERDAPRPPSSLCPEEATSQQRKVVAKDDSLAFLLEMQQKLKAEDYKRIFEDM